MDLAEKLEILADAAKYDVACTSSGANRSAKAGSLGAISQGGLCHSFTPDGRCISLLKVLMTNVCCYDCAYCVNRRSNEVRRAAFEPRELADLTIGFYRRNYIEGLFLSSGVLGNPDRTMELMIEAVRILREEYGFRGYIHAKAIPGASRELIDQMGLLVDRMSVNMELPSQRSLDFLAPEKTGTSVIAPMRQIFENRAEDRETRALARRNTTYLASYKQQKPAKKTRAYVPAGQSTQMIIGATPETDYHILGVSAALYRTVQMKRVFFSAYVPVNADNRLPETSQVPLDREHRLFQADWLLRFYGFDVNEIIDEAHPFLDLMLDPKANWALNNLDFFPVEVNTASYEELLRVPGIGVRGAKLIMRARKTTPLHEAELKKLGIALKRARYFITCGGRWYGEGIAFEADVLRAQLTAPIDGGRHGRRADKAIPGQMSLADLDESFNPEPAGRAPIPSSPTGRPQQDMLGGTAAPPLLDATNRGRGAGAIESHGSAPSQPKDHDGALVAQAAKPQGGDLLVQAWCA